jgi:phosphoribosyl 1,2-cyclic phosphodiesterase
VFVKKRQITVYAEPETRKALYADRYLEPETPCEELTAPVVCAGIRVIPFATSHDTVQSCGFRLEMPDGRICAICTDLGCKSASATEALTGCDLVLLESNYDEEMLEYGPYPPPLKARIRSGIGHLSNDDCAAAAALLLQSGVRRFVLGHLSRENNTPTLATVCTRNALKRMGAVPDRDFELLAAPVESMGKYMVI